MGMEYYLVKPEEKEIFYLGKHMSCPDGIVNRTYKSEPYWIDYDCFDDFFWDFLRENFSEFMYTNLDLERLRDLIYSIYSWCAYSKIYFDNDCRDNAEWLEWRETGSLTDLLRKAQIIQSINSLKVDDMDIHEEELAKYLFDGDTEKGKILLDLIHQGAVEKIETIMPTEMNIPED